MQKLSQQIEDLITTCEMESSDLEVDMTRLGAIQGAVARLMTDIDEIQFKGWDMDATAARISISEIERTVRLIDMAFYPLFKEVNGKVRELYESCSKLYKLTSELDTSSKEGWNCFAMENNIKTFIKEVGREPESFEEVSTYITKMVAKVEAAHGENKNGDALTPGNPGMLLK